MNTLTIDKELNKFKSIITKPLKLTFDTRMLDSILAFIYKDSALRTRKVLSNIYKLFNVIDDEIYIGNPQCESRIWIIRKSIYAILTEDFTNEEIIKTYCKENNTENNELINYIIDNISNTKITYEESKYLVKQLEDRLMYGYILNVKTELQELFDKVDSDDFKTYKQISEDIYDISIAIINNKRDNASLDTEQTFSLKEDNFDNVISESMAKLKDKNKIFTTGIKRWNTILGPGYMSKRLYTYLAFPGGGKSQILLKSALDMKKYNGRIKAKDPKKIPGILYITMENDVDETVERIFNMVGNSDDIRNYTPKQVVKMLKRDGGLEITDDNNIDILIRYYPNKSIDTNDLYSIIKDFEDSGYEIIALILDYLKRIRPAEKASAEKEELKNITNELKTLAKIKDIPVITAQQLNRTAATVVDAAIQAKKEDVTKLVGRDGIAGAWEIIENSDVVIILNQETKQDTGELFMTFKMIKRRYRSCDDSEKMRRLDYFNHPYADDNSICLLDDVDLDKSLSLYSLATKIAPDPNVGSRGRYNAIPRKTIEEIRQEEELKKKLAEDDSFGEFNPDLMRNF